MPQDRPACEEASCHGRARLAELLMGSDMIRPHVAVHTHVLASCRGFVDTVDTLIKAFYMLIVMKMLSTLGPNFPAKKMLLCPMMKIIAIRMVCLQERGLQWEPRVLVKMILLYQEGRRVSIVYSHSLWVWGWSNSASGCCLCHLQNERRFFESTRSERKRCEIHKYVEPNRRVHHHVSYTYINCTSGL